MAYSRQKLYDKILKVYSDTNRQYMQIFIKNLRNVPVYILLTEIVSMLKSERNQVLHMCVKFVVNSLK